MADKTWKRIEREKCRALGAERSGPTGRDTPDCDDACHVALEVKSYTKFVFLTADWQQAVENARKVGKPPVLAVKERGRGGRDQVQLGTFHLKRLVDSSKLRVPVTPGPTPDVMRIGWDDFVALYHATYNNDTEETLG